MLNLKYKSSHIDGCIHKISPSQISKFYDNPYMWYKEQLLKETKMIPTTSMVLGTLVHAVAEAEVKNEDYNQEEIISFVEEESITADIDIDTVLTNYPLMSKVLKDDFINQTDITNTELPVESDLGGDIWVGGTVDFIAGDTLGDYKTASKKPNLKKIPFNYKIQLLAYCYCLKKMGTNIKNIQIVYIVRPTKTLPARIFTVTESIEEMDWSMIENTLGLIKESVQVSNAVPTLRHIIWKHMSLKEY